MADAISSGGLFEGLTACFSSSVDERFHKLWAGNGGQYLTVQHADFLFSSVAESDDTVEIFRSFAYFQNRSTVLHPQYIVECLAKGNMKRVPLGPFEINFVDCDKMFNFEKNTDHSIDNNLIQTWSSWKSISSENGDVIDLNEIPECEGDIAPINLGNTQ